MFVVNEACWLIARGRVVVFHLFGLGSQPSGYDVIWCVVQWLLGVLQLHPMRVCTPVDTHSCFHGVIDSW